jgi:hypothetical protein
MKLSVGLFLFFSILTLGGNLAYSSDVLVIVNADNPIQEVGLIQIKNILLQKENTWRSGQIIHCIFPLRDSATFQNLLRGLFDMDESQWDNFWSSQLIQGKRPPKSADDIVIVRGVTKDLNALGVIGEKSFRGTAKDRAKVIFRLKLRQGEVSQ